MKINTLILYFIIYSFFGWIIESIYKTVRTKKIVNSGFLYGPLCPIYGFGALIMLLFLNGFSNNVFLLFIVGFFVLSVWEYIVAVILEKVLKTKYWDYSYKKIQIKGRVCLSNSIFWGFLGVVFIKVVHPVIENLIYNIEDSTLFYINLSLGIIILIDLIFTLIKVYNINISINLLNEITQKIKSELTRFKEFAGTKAKESEKLQHVIEELKAKQEKIKKKLEVQTTRLRKAFPTMKSLKTQDSDEQRKK